MIEKIRNIAIIAHVDHGKTTLVDKMLQQSGTLESRGGNVERVMDSNDQEKERGITILAKNTAISWNGYRINIVDTPGHADFGGEVERVLSMVDSVLLLVDAVDGPMPQTRFVTQKAFDQGLNPIVVINKVDRDGARPDWVVNEVFDLFDKLGATDEQLDFPIIYASALEGIAGLDVEAMATDMEPLFKEIVEKVPHPDVEVDAPLQMQISALDYNSYVGVIGIGRVTRGVARTNQQVIIVDVEGKQRKGKILQVKSHLGLERIDVDEAAAGEIVCISGIDKLNISDTICDPEKVEAMTPLSVDEPTISMTFQVNDSPFAGLEGKYVTTRNIKDRLDRELLFNVALRVEPGDTPDKYKVSGRGELHLSVLIETMRREGFELAVSRPEVIIQEIDGVLSEPYESLVIDCDDQHQGSVMEELGNRRAEMQDMMPDGKGRVRLQFLVPTRGLIGFRSQFLSLTSGSGLMTHVFSHYDEYKDIELAARSRGVLVSMVRGKTLGFSLFNLQDRGKLFVHPNTEVYEGMIIGLHSRENDLAVNPIKGKQLTNVRASGTDENIVLTPPVRHTLEQAMEFIADDELVEVTPESIRLRKRHLTENERKRHSRGSTRG
ncbi:MAG: translational GTPase TypA [Gammaproteobacteria bacterium]|uniref:Large ribosomal subunit assembly factor BipA n=5 Tax=OM182 clade TaxID=745002 RepID=A0A0R2TBJ7_9GAMM|nr:MAG: GTP-binding protein TypA [OM182 bacterium BACL3 MAG-120619-bin3]KRO85323.1 MAG: GTP-binding protein TypA [OM182 bacterium BACL3 MAG-120920-bin41]KRP28568.1 MAG: GTP-binding protein TypA [OM182 bacterium BACL3 MAG-120924-bin41]MBT3521657.1 translational GTPase TypA [Gammaproteobacteria bacterium]MDP4769131.1 translational GTPase TypA [OM182 bacterium]